MVIFGEIFVYCWIYKIYKVMNNLRWSWWSSDGMHLCTDRALSGFYRQYWMIRIVCINRQFATLYWEHYFPYICRMLILGTCVYIPLSTEIRVWCVKWSLDEKIGGIFFAIRNWCSKIMKHSLKKSHFIHVVAPERLTELSDRQLKIIGSEVTILGLNFVISWVK